jgi:hypothetical protein
MVPDSAQYRWSSYRYSGLGQTDSRIIPVYLSIDLNEIDRQSAVLCSAVNWMKQR